MPFVWDNGETTDVRVEELSVVPGTAKLAQRPDCIVTCESRLTLLTECGPDELAVQVSGTVKSKDGRLVDEPFTTTLYAHSDDGALMWRTTVELSLAELNGSARVREISDDLCPGELVGLNVWIDGADDTLTSVSMGETSVFEAAGEETTCFGTLGSTPR